MEGVVQPGALRRPPLVVQVGLAVLLLQLLLRGALASASWFFQDDFVLAAQASRGLTAGFLFQDYSGHIMPGGMFLVWATTALSPLGWGPPLAVVLLLQLATGLVVLRTLLLVVGTRAAALVPLAVLVLSPLTFNSVLWFGSGIQALPNLLALAVAVDGHLRHQRWGRARHAAQSLLGVAFGLAFYEKVLLVPALLVLLSVLPLAEGRGRRRLAGLWARKGYWAAHIGLGTAYLTLYFLRTGEVDGSASTPSDWPTVVQEAARTVAVALVGGPWRTRGDALVGVHVAPPTVVVVAVAAGLAALVGWTVARGGRRALDAWLVLVLYVLLDAALLIVGRGPLAPFLASDPRYFADAVPVAALALGLALRAVLDAHPAAGSRPLLSRRTGLAWAAAGAVVVVGSVQSTVVLGTAAGRNDARGYVAAMRASLRDDPDVTVGDTPASRLAIVRAFLGGDASVEQVLEPLPEAARFRTPGSRLRVFDQRGRLVEGILLHRVAAPRGKDGDCGYRVDRSLTVPLDAPGPTYEGHVRVTYLTGASRFGEIEAGGRRFPVVFHKGLNDWWVPVSGTRLDDVVVRAPAMASALCVTSVEAGRMWPPREQLPD